MIAYLSVAQALRLHSMLVETFGGSSGVRDRGALAAAMARPMMTFDGDDLYPDLPSKAAALMHSLVMNHPFIDGNKRVAVACAELFCELNGQLLDASDEDFEEITLDTARGEVEADALTIWFRQRLRTP